jgi:hypothetical protein
MVPLKPPRAAPVKSQPTESDIELMLYLDERAGSAKEIQRWFTIARQTKKERGGKSRRGRPPEPKYRWMDEVLLNTVLRWRERDDCGLTLPQWIRVVGRLVYNQEDWGSFDHMIQRVLELYRERIRSGTIRSE